MEQRTIVITNSEPLEDGTSKKWGVFTILQINWDEVGQLTAITVNFGGKMVMTPYKDTGTFRNVHGNLTGTLIF